MAASVPHRYLLRLAKSLTAKDAKDAKTSRLGFEENSLAFFAVSLVTALDSDNYGY